MTHCGPFRCAPLRGSVWSSAPRAGPGPHGCSGGGGRQRKRGKRGPLPSPPPSFPPAAVTSGGRSSRAASMPVALGDVYCRGESAEHPERRQATGTHRPTPRCTPPCPAPTAARPPARTVTAAARRRAALLLLLPLAAVSGPRARPGRSRRR